MARDLKQTHEALKEAEAKYRTIFENSKDVVFITTIDGKFIDINQAGIEMLGYSSKNELIRMKISDTYLHPEASEIFQKEITKEGFVKDFETKLKRKDETTVDCLITANLRRDGKGDVIGYGGIIKNISDRKKIEEELFQRTKELQTLYDLSILINQSLDLEGVLPIALERSSALTGFESGGVYLFNENEGIFELKFHKGCSPAFIDRVKVLKCGEGVCGRAIQLRKPIFLSIDEFPFTELLPFHKSEEIQSIVGIPLLAKGKVTGAITLSSRSIRTLSQREMNFLESVGNQIGLALENAKLFSNVTKVKSEWETTFDAVTDLITIRDKDYRILRANRAAFKRFGLGPEEMIGKKCFEALHHRDKPCVRCHLSRTLITKKPASGERESKFLNGVIQYHTFPIYDEGGEIVAVIDLSREITEQKRMEMEKELVNNVNKILASSLDVRQVMQAVHSELRKVLNSERMTITILLEKGEWYRFFSLNEDLEAKEVIGHVTYPIEGTPIKKVLETGLPAVITDSAEIDSWFYQRLLKEGIRSSLIFPLEYKGKIIGTINLSSRETNHFSENQFNFLYQISTGLAISIQNTLLFEEIKKKLDELTILYEITKISTSFLDLNLMLEKIINSLSSFFRFEGLGILLMDENTKRLFPHPASYKELSIKDIGKLELCVGKGITGWVAEHGEPLLVNDVRKDSRFICSDESILSEICAPLRVGQKVIGVIDAQSRKLDAFSKDNLRLLSIAGVQIAILIENVRLYEEIMQSEEKYRTVVEGAMDGVLIVGEDYRFKFVNERLAEILGRPQIELIDTDFRDYVEEESRQMVADRYIRRQRGEDVPSRYEFNVIRKDGEMRNVEISSTIVQDFKGKANAIAFVKDITEKKKMEEQLIQTEKLRALGEMASGVAHDFNNALAIILGNTQLLLYTVKDEKLKETLRTIEKVAKDSAQTVRRLLDFTRKKAREEVFKLDINSIVQDAMEIAKPKWKDEVQSKGILIEMVTDFDDIPPVLGNAFEMREVIASMILNAIEAMPGGGKIVIQTFQRKEKVYIQISDTGVGMTEEVREKVFEPFFTTKPFSNTGLGLSMCYGIIKRLGGEIEVESKVGKGTTFTIVLPGELKEKEEKMVPSLIQKGRETRILVIDDEEEVRSVLLRILSQVGRYRVTIAKNGEEGIRLFKEKDFDMVLTDLGMPGVSGWQVCRAIKEMSPHTPVGMITGWGVEIDQAKVEETRTDFVISKPFQLEQILRVLDQTMTSTS